MKKITSVTELKNAIYVLEDEMSAKQSVLHQQFILTYESLKPINLLKNALKEVSSSPFFIKYIAGAAIGAASGYFTKKVVVGTSVNILRKLLGSILQVGITTVIASKHSTFKSIGAYLFRSKKRENESIN